MKKYFSFIQNQFIFNFAISEMYSMYERNTILIKSHECFIDILKTSEAISDVIELTCRLVAESDSLLLVTSQTQRLFSNWPGGEQL